MSKPQNVAGAVVGLLAAGIALGGKSYLAYILSINVVLGGICYASINILGHTALLGVKYVAHRVQHNAMLFTDGWDESEPLNIWINFIARALYLYMATASAVPLLRAQLEFVVLHSLC